MYQKRFESLLEQNSLLANAERKGLEKGIKQGIKEGIKQGIEQGLQQGLLEGENKKSIEIAINLLDVLDNETISAKTGLTISEIKRLRNK